MPSSVFHIRWKAFLRELGKRKVVQVGIAYAAASWLLIQLADVTVDAFALPDWIMKLVFVLLFLGFPAVIILSWVFDLIPGGVIATGDSEELLDDILDTQEPRNVALLCADVVGYQELKSRHEGEAENLLNYASAIIRPRMKRWGGVHLQKMTDTMICVFADEVAALCCALSIQRVLGSGGDLTVRIALTHGACVRDGEHIAGEAINESFHLEPVALPGGIVVSENFWRQLARHPEMTPHIDRLHAGATTHDHLPCYLAGPDELESLSALAHQQPGVADPGKRALPVRLRILTGALLLVLLGGAYYWYMDSFSGIIETRTTPAIAVMPFANLSGDPANDYIGEGIADELIHLLSAHDQLRVASTSSVFALRHRKLDAVEIGDQLEVDLLLEGSVRQIADELRVIVRLVNADDGYQMWSDAFSWSGQDFLELEDRISSRLLDSLDLPERMDRADLARATSANTSAVDLFLKANGFLRKPASQETLAQAEQYFTQALRLDPGFTRAIAGLCRTYLNRFRKTLDTALMDTAKIHCQLAVHKDPNSSEANVGLAGYYFTRGMHQAALLQLENVLARDRDHPEALLLTANVYLAMEQHDRAQEYLQRAIRREPGYWQPVNDLGRLYLSRGQYPLALEQFIRASALEPDSAAVKNNLGVAHYLLGDFGKAAAAYHDATQKQPDPSAFSNAGTMYYYDHQFEKAAGMFEKALTLSPADYRMMGNIADALDKLPERQQEAKSHYRMALEQAAKNLEVNPRDSSAMMLIPWYQVQLDELDAAQSNAELALQIHPDNVEVQYFSALVYTRLGKRDIASRHLGKCLQLGYPPELIKAEPLLAWFQVDAATG